MNKKSEEDILEKSKEVCENIASRIEESDGIPSPIEIKMMIEDELEYGLSEDEIVTLAVTFKHIDDLFEGLGSGSFTDGNLMFR